MFASTPESPPFAVLDGRLEGRGVFPRPDAGNLLMEHSVWRKI